LSHVEREEGQLEAIDVYFWSAIHSDISNGPGGRGRLARKGWKRKSRRDARAPRVVADLDATYREIQCGGLAHE